MTVSDAATPSSLVAGIAATSTPGNTVGYRYESVVATTWNSEGGATTDLAIEAAGAARRFVAAALTLVSRCGADLAAVELFVLECTGSASLGALSADATFAASKSGSL